MYSICGYGEMADTVDSKSIAERHKGSSPFIRTSASSLTDKQQISNL